MKRGKTGRSISMRAASPCSDLLVGDCQSLISIILTGLAIVRHASYVRVL